MEKKKLCGPRATQKPAGAQRILLRFPLVFKPRRTPDALWAHTSGAAASILQFLLGKSHFLRGGATARAEVSRPRIARELPTR